MCARVKLGVVTGREIGCEDVRIWDGAALGLGLARVRFVLVVEAENVRSAAQG